MIKNPIKRQNTNTELPCGDIKFEITENQGLDISGGTMDYCNWQNVTAAIMGDNGHLCTWTVECQKNCSK